MAHAQKLKNLKVIHHDAIEVLEHMIPAHALACVQLFFADPWHKKKHHKRRIVQVPFVKKARVRFLEKGGIFHLATDWENYAEHMVEIMAQTPWFKNRHQKDILYQDLRIVL